MKELIDLANSLRNSDDHSNVISQFVESRSFPIVDAQRATFFFWDSEHIDSIYLVHWVYGLESKQRFSRIPNSNAFFLSVDLPYYARVEYKFEIHRHDQQFWSRDPYNPQLAFDPFGSNSVCAMPGYQEPDWIRVDPNAQKGRLEEFTLQNNAFGDERKVTVYLPNEHRPRKSYPLLICHDGHDYRKYASIINVLDNLIHRHEVMPLIVAFTDGVQRNIEYGANPQQAQYIVEDLLPALESRYRLQSGAQNRALMGASFGGVTSLFTAWRYPGVFSRLLLQSGSFAFTDIGEHGRGELWDPVVEFVNALREDPSSIQGKVYMSCGVFESLIYFNRSLAPLLREQGTSIRFVESQDGHNWINWRDRLREGLSWLYPGRLWMYYE